MTPPQKKRKKLFTIHPYFPPRLPTSPRAGALANDGKHPLKQPLTIRWREALR
jgi:hypothetical protein